MLKMNNLVAGYSGMPAIHGITFEVKEGQIVVLLGANGSGKTTTIRAITNVIKPYSGEVLYKGENLLEVPTHKIVTRKISMVPEGRQLFPKMSIYDNLMMGAYTIQDSNLIKEKLDIIYDIFPVLEERKNQLTGTLSGGEQQMTAIGRALISDPELLILDEPSLGIMPKLVDEIFEFIKKINKMGVSILMVEQNAEKALAFADYAHVIANGVVEMSGEASTLMNDEKVKEIYLGIN